MEVYDPETNTWRRLADDRFGSQGSGMVNRKIYVLAGYVGNRQQRCELESRRDVGPETDTWVLVPTPRIQLGIGVVAGKIFVTPRDQKPGAPWRINLVDTPITDTKTSENDGMALKQQLFGIPSMPSAERDGRK